MVHSVSPAFMLRVASFPARAFSPLASAVSQVDAGVEARVLPLPEELCVAAGAQPAVFADAAPVGFGSAPVQRALDEPIPPDDYWVEPRAAGHCVEKVHWPELRAPEVLPDDSVADGFPA